MIAIADIYDVERTNNLIGIREKRAYGWFRCFTEEEALELVLKLATELGLCVED